MPVSKTLSVCNEESVGETPGEPQAAVGAAGAGIGGVRRGSASAVLRRPGIERAEQR